jgi:integral membrane sensor domain MASE1
MAWEWDRLCELHAVWLRHLASDLLSAFLVNMTTAGSVLTSLGIACGNNLEGLVGVYLVRRFANGSAAFDRPRDIFRFILFACFVSTTVSASFGVTSLSLGGYARWSNYAWIWLNWWLGDATGDLIVAPLLVLRVRPRVAPINYKPIAVVWLALLMLLTGLVVFGGLLPSGMRNYPIEFLCIIPILWAAFRFGSLETATTVALLVLIAIDGTLHGFGPFARLTKGESLMLLQAFSATTAAVTLPIGPWFRRCGERSQKPDGAVRRPRKRVG